MACSCKHMAREIAEYKQQIHKLRNCFIKRMTVDSETQDRRRKDYNQAIFCDYGNGEHEQVFSCTTMEMVLDCFDAAVKDWYDVKKKEMYIGYSSYNLNYVREWLKENFEIVDSEIDNLLKRQKTEIERLKSMNQAKLDCIHDLQKENEILSRNADAAFQDGLNERRDLFAPEIKAEAYKEFAERLKSSIYINTNLLVYQCAEVESKIDDIVKEMVGETDD